MRFYRISIGSGRALQYVAHAAPVEGNADDPYLTWTHEQKRAGEFLRLGTARIVRHLLMRGAERITVEEVS